MKCRTYALTALGRARVHLASGVRTFCCTAVMQMQIQSIVLAIALVDVDVLQGRRKAGDDACVP